MFTRAAAAALLTVTLACGSDAEPSPPAPATVATAETAETAEATSSNDTPPATPTPTTGTPDTPATPAAGDAPRPATAAARAARFAALPEAQRAASQTYRTSLREGRRLGRAGDHEAALAAFERALAIAPGDASAECEAGFQAQQLDRLDDAVAHFHRGLRAPRASDRTKGACLYNLARVTEARGHPAAAIEFLERSLRLRPNRVAQAKLEELRAAAAPTGSTHAGYAYVEEGAIDPTVYVGRPAQPSLAALCQAFECRVREDDAPTALPARPGGTTEVAIVDFVQDFGMPSLHVLVVRDADGWHVTEFNVGECDERDMFGRIEPCESQTITAEGARFVVHVSGSTDEAEWEYDAWYTCEHEGERREDEGNTEPFSIDECYEEASRGQDPPERWARRITFSVGAEGVEMVSSEDVEPAPIAE